jgi:hypothetical protein
MLRISSLVFALLFVTSQVLAGDFSGSWSGEIKSVSHHHSQYGDLSLDLTQDNAGNLTGTGFVKWENGYEKEFDFSADVDVDRSTFAFHHRHHGYESWGFGVLTEVEGSEVIVGVVHKKNGHHGRVKSFDITLYRAE